MRWLAVLISTGFCLDCLAQGAILGASHVATLPTPTAASDSLVSAAGVVVALCEGGKVLVWSASEAKSRREFDRGESAANLLAISDDGRLAVLRDKRDGVLVLDLATGASRFETRLKRPAMIGPAYVASSPVAFSHDSRRLAVAAIGEAAQIFDLQTGRRAYSLSSTLGGANAIAFSRDDHLIASAGGDGSVSVYDASSGRLIAKNEDLLSEVFAIDFSADGKEVIAGGGDRVVLYINAATGRAVRRSNEVSEPVMYIGVSPKGADVAIALMQADHNMLPAPVYLSDVQSGDLIRSWPPPATIHAIGWTSRGRLLATTVTPQAVEVWNIR
jgi:WD40 repeat protein